SDVCSSDLVLVTQLLDSEFRRTAVQDAKHDLFAKERRQCANAEVDLLCLAQIELNSSVLGYALLGNIQLRHHLQAGRNSRLKLHRNLCGLFQQSVNSQAHAILRFVGLEVDVGSAAT